MHPPPPIIQGDTLHDPTGATPLAMCVGSAAWFAWLDQATHFVFQGRSGCFLAHKYRDSQGSWSWHASCQQQGLLAHCRLGMSSALTLTRLERAARVLKRHATLACRQALPPRGQRLRQQAVPTTRRIQQMPGPVASRAASLPKPCSARPALSREGLLPPKPGLPPERQGIVSRQRLLDQLDQAVIHPLTLLVAPAGSGKTTLLSQWNHQCPHRLAWVALDADQNDPLHFWRLVVLALEQAQPGVGEVALEVLERRPPLPVEPVVLALVHSLLAEPEPLFLVLDDVQRLRDPAIHASLTWLLDNLPACLHLVLASRSRPPWALARLRLADQVLEVPASDLQFTEEEVAAFCSLQATPSLSEEEASLLSTATEGWIAGVRLAVLALEGAPDRAGTLALFTQGRHRALVDYLLEEVLEQQPEEVQRFLLQTALFKPVSGPLCDAVTQSAGSQARLEELERLQLFLVPLDAERRWYRYHHLFASFLRERLARHSPEEGPVLHQRAARWYEQQGMYAEAIAHALACKDFVSACYWVEQAVEPTIRRGELMLLLNWLEALPAELVQGRPQLGISHAWVLAQIGRGAAAENSLQAVEQKLLAEAAQDSASRIHQQLQAQLSLIHGELARQRGDQTGAIAYYQQALELLPANETFLRAFALGRLGLAYLASGDFATSESLYTQASLQATNQLEPMLLSLGLQGHLQFVQGRLHQAAALFWQALERAQEAGLVLTPIASLAYLSKGWVLYEADELAEAEAAVLRGLASAQQWGHQEVWLRGQILLLQLKQAQGERGQAAALLTQIEQFARTIPPPHPLARLASLSCARVWLANGEVRRAITWIEAAGLEPEALPGSLGEEEALVVARVLLAQGQRERALALLERLQQQAQQGDRQERMMELRLLQALGFAAQSQPRQALRALAQALSEAERLGYFRLFLDAGPPLNALLLRLAQVHGRPGFPTLPPRMLALLQRLLVASGYQPLAPGPAQSARGVPEETVPLSARERTLLRLLAAGYSNAEIAGEVVLEVSTVKSHLKHLYQKLLVHSRAQAVARARSLSLL